MNIYNGVFCAEITTLENTARSLNSQGMHYQQTYEYVSRVGCQPLM